MDPQGQTGVPGPTGRMLHIAHRRSPSEMTPMISKCCYGLLQYCPNVSLCSLLYDPHYTDDFSGRSVQTYGRS